MVCLVYGKPSTKETTVKSVHSVRYDPKMNEHTQLGLGTTWRSMFSSEGASSSAEPEDGPPFDFISVLAVAQNLDVDFLPITWQPALEIVGEGATAEIRQSLINLQVSFAFKRFKGRWKSLSSADESKELQRISSEIRLLGEAEIREHPNIIRLEGLCWDISSDNRLVWPVLVFEKTNCGNLTEWSASNEGKTAGHGVRLKLCADIANAISNLHRHRRYLAFFSEQTH